MATVEAEYGAAATTDETRSRALKISNAALIRVFELYSNAIVAFFVVQSLTLSFTFGTNLRFGCLMRSVENLATGIVAQMVATALLSCFAIYRMRCELRGTDNDSIKLLCSLYSAKIVAILLFTALPVILLLSYGSMIETIPFQECVRQFSEA